MDKMKLYNSVPIFVQNLGCRFEGSRLSALRYGGSFQEHLHEYMANNQLPLDRIIELRNEKLRQMVIYCYEQIPFYKDLFNECGFNVESFQDDRDLLLLPVLDKQTVRENTERLRPRNMKVVGKYITEHTSGSTGSSLVFPQSVENIRDLWAVFWRFWCDLGIDFGTTYADFGSRTIVPHCQVKPPFWRESQGLFQVKFSAFHGNDENYMAYYKEIAYRKLSWIHGYPTCIVPFAAFMVEHDLVFDHEVKWVTTSAENLYDHQKSLMEQAFGVKPHSLYALTEATACLHESLNHDMTVDEEYSLVELIPDIKNTDLCHIVGSNLSNLAFPLLRYDSGDLVEFSGRTVQGRRVVERIDGRSTELLKLPGGGTVGALSALFSDSSAIKEAQVMQKADYSVVIKYVPVNELYQTDLEKAAQRFKERTRGLIPLTFERMEKIPRTERGKLRYIVSEVP